MAEALNASNDELFAVLKGQWVHRFGVDTLNEINYVAEINDLNESNRPAIENVTESVKDSKQVDLKSSNDQSNLEEKLNRRVDQNDIVEISIEREEIKRNSNENIYQKPIEIENKKNSKVEPIIPIPPRPKLNYLRKWLYN